jgi:tRNA (pseudouridine54-N1)-methyltransferase
MKHFVYFSASAATSGNFDLSNLMKAGRMDIAIHSLISAIFLSHDLREDVQMHFIFYGMPDPPKHIQIQASSDLQISKKDVGSLIKKMLYKYRKGEKFEVFPKCFIEKKSFLNVVEELIEEGNEVYLLDKKGEDIREINIGENCAFIIGDQNGFPKKELKRLKKMLTLISVGPKMYFASQVVTIVNNELDRKS